MTNFAEEAAGAGDEQNIMPAKTAPKRNEGIEFIERSVFLPEAASRREKLIDGRACRSARAATIFGDPSGARGATRPTWTFMRSVG